MQNSNEFYFSVDRVKQEDIDKTCKAYYEQDKKWYNAKILNVDSEALEAEV
jgi:survival-of-motor-neuron-related-splicing factor 30